MEKDQNIETENLDINTKVSAKEVNQNKSEEDINQKKTENDNKINETTPEEKIKELEDKVARTFAEMENQRRRFEKEKEDAFDYGGFSFAKESLNLIDNLERSKQILLSDENLKGTDALKKTESKKSNLLIKN